MLSDITPVILTFNEAENIGRALECLGWARRIVGLLLHCCEAAELANMECGSLLPLWVRRLAAVRQRSAVEGRAGRPGHSPSAKGPREEPFAAPGEAWCEGGGSKLPGFVHLVRPAGPRLRLRSLYSCWQSPWVLAR